MSKYSEKKAAIMADQHSSNTVSNRGMFDALFTAMVNDPDYESVEVVIKKGEVSESVTKPVVDLRKSLIGSVASAAGADSAETKALIEKHEFPVLPVYNVVANAIEEYCAAGKSFRFPKRGDLQGTLTIKTEPEKTKEHNNPRCGVDGEPARITKLYHEHRRYKVESKCPTNLTETVGKK